MSTKSNIKELFTTALKLKEVSKDRELKQLYTPISFRQFANSLLYSGLEPGDMWNFWIEEIQDFISGNYTELIITGSLGSGKTLAANLLLMYKIYELFSYEEINKYLKLPLIQPVENLYFGPTQRQAAVTGFAQFKAMLDSSRWFGNNFPRDKHIESVLKWKGGKFNFFSGSSHAHALGMTVWSFIFDEADFFNRAGGNIDESYERAVILYDELADRRASRFKKYGKDYSFSVIISSTTYQSSFTDNRIKLAMNDKSVKIINAVGYKVKPKGTYSNKKFFVFVGDKMIDAEILDRKEQIDILARKYIKKPIYGSTLQEKLRNLPVKVRQKIEAVPVDFRAAFDRNISKSLMNHAGISISRVGKLLSNKSLLLSAYSDDLQHPFTKQEIEISTADKVQIKDYFLSGMLDGRDKPHGIHIDQSLSSDDTGISMVRYDGSFKEENDVVRRKFTQVFSIRGNPPPPPSKIKLMKIVDFIVYLYKELEINIVKVTFDQYQSAMSIQILEDEGLTVGRLSIDKDDSAYLIFLDVLEDQCFNMYSYPILEREISEAIHYRRKKKVDHPKGTAANPGSIDIFQSLVGALKNVYDEDEISTSEEDVYDGMLKKVRAKRDREAAAEGLVQGKLLDTVEDYFSEMKNLSKKSGLIDSILGEID